MDLFIHMLFFLTFFMRASSASFPPTPQDITTIPSKKFSGRSISYKQTYICETSPGVKSFSGYVNLPADESLGRASSTSIYFWYFEARNDPKNAPLAMWLQGGPGVPSITAAVGENGPCLVMDDSKSTKLNPWSWNEEANMLYIDQPVQAGFSYNNLVNGTLNELPLPFIFEPANFSKVGVPETNLTFLTGTFAEPDIGGAPNTTIAAAPVMWDFMQTWMQEFPEHHATRNRFSIWAESYGGHYAPVYANYFEEQNDRIAQGKLRGPAKPIHMPFYPEFAFNNTYGIKAINESQYKAALAAADDCRELTTECRKLASEQDPMGRGNNPDVNDAYLEAYLFCFSKMHSGYDKSRNLFDIASPVLESFPPKWPAGYFNTPEIQQALGVPLNFTGNSMVIASTFNLTGDFVRGDSLLNLGTLLDKGTNVAMVYGDRDYQCNWLGGEAISTSIDWKASSKFSQAGYAELRTNASYVGGLVRQFGNLSFARVYQAGHEVPYYQPETAQQIFNRVMSKRDVAAGKDNLHGGYHTTGRQSAFTPSGMPPHEDPPRCYVWDVFETCTAEEQKVLANGTAVTENFIVVGYLAADGSTILFNSTNAVQ